jgi:predicted Zn-dependent peptidase
MAVGPAAFQEEHPAFRIAVRILGGMYASRANRVFREERGESYGATASVSERAGHAVLDFAIDVRTPQLEDALALFLRELARLGDPAQIDEDELATARALEVSRERARLEDPTLLAQVLLHALVEADDPDALLRRIEALERVDRDEVAAVARRWLAPHVVAISVEGERSWMLGRRFSAPGGTERVR